MKKFKITFYTSNILVNGDESEQDSFHGHADTENEKATIEDVADNIIDVLESSVFISNDKGNHFYRTSSITDFSIKEVEERE